MCDLNFLICIFQHKKNSKIEENINENIYKYLESRNFTYYPSRIDEEEDAYQITEYIETGKTEAKAMEIIQKKKKMSEHKRKPIPVYRNTEA